MENPFSSATATSVMRISMFICVLIAGAAAIISICLARDLMGTAAVVTALLVPAFGGKAIQSFAESDSKIAQGQPLEPKI